MKTFFNLALSGLSEPDAVRVMDALKSPKLDKWSLAEGGNSDLMVIDVDSVWGHMDWLRAVSEDRKCVAYTEQEAMRDCELLLRKPLDTHKLTDILLAVQKGQQPESDAPAPDTAAESGQHDAGRAVPEPPVATQKSDLPKPDTDKAATAARLNDAAKAAAQAPTEEPPQDATPEPDPTPAPQAAPAAPAPATVGAMLLSGGISEPVLVQANDIKLAIDPASDNYHAPPQLKPLEKLLNAPTEKMQAVASTDPLVQHAGPQQPIVRLLWFAALCASDGRLAAHLDPDATWHLTRWPQIEREFPRHFRIATAMMKQAGTLEEVAAAAKSPVEDVANFINAYYVAGYVAAEGSDEPVEAANSTPNVLSRLRRSFNRGAQSS